MTYSDVAIIGAGPYGLSVSAQLSYRGIEHRIFGPPMQTWRSMPKGMCLKSLDFATNIYSPKKGYSLIEYCESHGLSHAEPLSGELVSNYGCWAQEQLVPHLEPAEVTRLAPTSRGFEISLPSGEKLEARRVVMATGLAYFANLPSKLRGLPRELVSHTSDHRDYDRFRDKDVWVLGSGQSAIEAAVMLYEIGARPTVLTRGAPVSFAGPPVPKRILRHRIMYPMSVLGPSRIGFFLQHVPMGFYHLPDAKRIALTRKLYGPWGAWWIAKRFEGKVPGISHTEILSATPRGDKLELKLASRHGGAEREVLIDHLVCGTGYEPDLDVIPFLDKNLASGVRRIERSPKLSPHFESSTPGLYFVGASAAFSFGPLLRFVAGAEFAAPTVAKHLASSAARGAHAA